MHHIYLNYIPHFQIPESEVIEVDFGKTKTHGADRSMNQVSGKGKKVDIEIFLNSINQHFSGSTYPPNRLETVHIQM